MRGPLVLMNSWDLERMAFNIMNVGTEANVHADCFCIAGLKSYSMDVYIKKR